MAGRVAEFTVTKAQLLPAPGSGAPTGELVLDVSHLSPVQLEALGKLVGAGPVRITLKADEP